jgi:iron complex transport system permease protein
MSLGAVFGIICDDLARVLTTGEVPLGIITSLIGAVIFLLMMTSRSMRIAR